MRINPNLYRYTEQALREYPDDVRRLKVLEEYLEAPVGPGERVDGGESMSEQERIVMRKARDSEFRELANQIRPIREFLDSLSSLDMTLVEKRYFEGRPWKEIAEELHASEQVCRCRRAPRLICRAAYLIFGDLIPRKKV